MRGKVVVSSDVVVGELDTFRSEGNQVENDHPKLSRDTFASSNGNLSVEEVQVEANEHFEFRRREAQVHDRREGGSLCNRAKSDECTMSGCVVYVEHKKSQRFLHMGLLKYRFILQHDTNSSP